MISFCPIVYSGCAIIIVNLNCGISKKFIFLIRILFYFIFILFQFSVFNLFCLILPTSIDSVMCPRKFSIKYSLHRIKYIFSNVPPRRISITRFSKRSSILPFAANLFLRSRTVSNHRLLSRARNSPRSIRRRLSIRRLPVSAHVESPIPGEGRRNAGRFNRDDDDAGATDEIFIGRSRKSSARGRKIDKRAQLEKFGSASKYISYIATRYVCKIYNGHM